MLRNHTTNSKAMEFKPLLHSLASCVPAMAGEVDPPVTESVFAQAVLAAAPHGGSCEVLRLAEGKLWTSGADGRLACSSHEGVGQRVFNFWHRANVCDKVDRNE